MLEYIYSSHKAGAATAAAYVPIWDALKGRVDMGAYGDGAFDAVRARLVFGASEAERFSSIVVNYFTNLTNTAPTTGVV